MIVSLEEAKLYLRVDGDEENTLITNFILAVEDIVEAILRFPLTDFDEVPKPVKHAIYYGVAQFYEKRNELVMDEMLDTIKKLLFIYRMEAW